MSFATSLGRMVEHLIFVYTVPLYYHIPHHQTLWTLNSSPAGQNGRYFPDVIFKCIFLNENVWISGKIWLKFVPKSPIDNIPALVHIMAWRLSGDKPLCEPMLTQFKDAYMQH